MQFEIRLSGLEDVLELMECAQEEAVLSAAQPALAQSLDMICQEAVQLCPVDTGSLAASIHAACTLDAGGLSGCVCADAPHAGFVELGTYSQAAQPFLYPALLMHQEESAQRIFAAVMQHVKNGG